MEKITAYKAFNGRLFESEDKCLSYEKKMSEYPKRYIEDKANPMFDIVCHTEYVKTAPNQPKTRTEQYIIVNKRFKIGGFISPVDIDRLQNFNEYDLLITENDSLRWGSITIYLTKLLLKHNDFNEDMAEGVIATFQKNNHLKMQVTDNRPNEMWYFEDIRWHTGVISMNGIRLEIMS